MNLAILVSPENHCPPRDYGGSERRAAIYAVEFLQRGHTVDVFCREGSEVPATRVFGVPRGMANQRMYIQEIVRLSARNFRYDAILDMTPHHVASQIEGQPVVSVMGGDPFKRYPHDTVRNRVYVSKALADHYGNPNTPVVPNIIHPNPDDVKLGDGGGGYALYVGAIRPEKGVAEAAAAAKAAGMPLWVFGPKTDPAYYHQIRHDITYCGMLPSMGEDRWDVFRAAEVFLYPIMWCDACPLSPMEAMLAGTPVVARPNGGIVEYLQPRVNGYWMDDDSPEASILGATHLDRQRVRESILPVIDVEQAVTQYLTLLRRAAEGEIWNGPTKAQDPYKV